MSWRLCGSWKVCVPSAHGTECGGHKLICTTVRLEKTVRGERAKSVANCCLSVKTVRDKHVNSLVRPAVQKMESVHLHVFV